MADDLAAEMENLLSTDAQEKPPLFELRPAAGKGLGLFAASSIKRGTLIIEEAPLMWVPPEAEDETGRKLSYFVEALKASTPEQRIIFFRLYSKGRAEASPEVLQILRQEGEGPHLISDLLDAVAIFQSNSVAMGETGEHGSGVFASYSRINHSCSPNVHNSYNPTLKKLTVYAIKQINKGEEIVTSYVNLDRTYEQRKTALLTWDIDCGCRCCAGLNAAASQRRRELIFDADQKLAAYARGIRFGLGFSVPRNAQEALDVAKEVLKLLTDERLVGMHLTGVYRECSTFSLACGMSGEAVKYAKKELEVERYCIGENTAHLEKDMKGAEFWLPHVVSEHLKIQEKQRAEEKLQKAKLAEKSGKAKAKNG